MPARPDAEVVGQVAGIGVPHVDHLAADPDALGRRNGSRDDHVVDRGAARGGENEARRDGVGPQGRAVRRLHEGQRHTRSASSFVQAHTDPDRAETVESQDPARTERLGAVRLGHGLHPGFHDRDAIDRPLAKLHDHR